jgi:hypothetical protein
MKLRITTAHTLHKQKLSASKVIWLFLEIKREITFSGFHGWQRTTSHITAHTTGPDFYLTSNSMQQNPA